MVIVRNIQEMQMKNRIWWKRVIVAESRYLMRMADFNEQKSKEIAEKVKFTGILISQIKTKPINEFKVQVISSAPHAYSIDKGKPGVNGYVSFSEEPGLENWVKNKLSALDPSKANYFLAKQAVKIGMKGFPFGFPEGIKSMEIGYEYAIANSNMILGDELIKLGGIA